MTDGIVLQVLLLASGILLGWGITFASKLAEIRRIEGQLHGCELRLKSATDAVGQAESRGDGFRDKLQESEVARARLQQAMEQFTKMEADLVSMRTELQETRQTKTVAEGLLQRVREDLEREINARQGDQESLRGLGEALKGELKAMTDAALQQNQDAFLKTAGMSFKASSDLAFKDMGEHRNAIAMGLDQLSKELEKYKAGLDAVEKTRAEAYGSITQELKSVATGQQRVQEEASRLVNALRAAPKTRGLWGEYQLKNVFDLAGMSQHVDYELEKTFIRGDDERLRPDAVIRLPGERTLIVDAKTSMAAYLDALEKVDDAEKTECLKRHAAQVRAHMEKLADKAYWEGLTLTPDFVVMFIPGDNFFAAAMEHDRSLFEDALNQRVIMVTPSTLVALAKTVSFVWRQDKIAANARTVATLGKELYHRMVVMGDKVELLGKNIRKSADAYNAFVGSLESSVLPKARQFKDMEVEGTTEEVPSLESVVAEIKTLQRGRDMEFPVSEEP